MSRRRGLNTYGFGWHLFTLGEILLIAAVVGLLAGEVAAAVFTLGLGVATFLVCVTSLGKSKPRTVASEPRIRVIAWLAVAVGLCAGVLALIQAKLGDSDAAWGAGIAAIGALIIGASAVLSRSYELRRRDRADRADLNSR